MNDSDRIARAGPHSPGDDDTIARLLRLAGPRPHAPEATVKRVYFEGDRVRFQPSNPRMAPIYVREQDFRSTMLLGVVVGIYRKLR